MRNLDRNIDVFGLAAACGDEPIAHLRQPLAAVFEGPFAEALAAGIGKPDVMFLGGPIDACKPTLDFMHYRVLVDPNDWTSGFISRADVADFLGKHTNGVRLTVSFMDNPPADLRARILSHMNAWAQTANVTFSEGNTDPQVRIARMEGAGYWSYLGTDILSIAADQPTMNLEAFTMSTPESEFHRVVRHETGHTLGCPHEHLRQELVDKIDPDKAISYFGQTQGWSPEEVRQQVLTPIEESSLIGTDHDDPYSIMCYQLPGTITKDGQPIIGGTDIDDQDFQFMAKIYPRNGAMIVPVGAGTSLAAGVVPSTQQAEILRLHGETRSGPI